MLLSVTSGDHFVVWVGLTPTPSSGWTHDPGQGFPYSTFLRVFYFYLLEIVVIHMQICGVWYEWFLLTWCFACYISCSAVYSCSDPGQLKQSLPWSQSMVKERGMSHAQPMGGNCTTLKSVSETSAHTAEKRAERWREA